MRITTGLDTFFSALLIAACAPFPLSAQLLNNFAGFESLELDNGLTVWLKQLPAQTVSVSVAVPVGRWHDPVGQEQMAHFLEHMMFAGRGGLTEQEIKRQVSDRGGTNNAMTFNAKTFYFVNVGVVHTKFAIDWMYRLISPPIFDREDVTNQLTPISIEVRAHPRDLFDWIAEKYLFPPFLRPGGFWEREFGIETRFSRDYYPYRSLRNIGPEDLLDFYQRHYQPSNMTLSVIGDFDRDSVLAMLETTFGTLPDHAAVRAPAAPTDPGRQRRIHYWLPTPTVFYSNRFKVYEPTAQEDLMLAFVERFLSERLNNRLRFSDGKSVYGISVRVSRNGSVGYLGISGRIQPDMFELVQQVVDEEIRLLRDGFADGEEFELIRAGIETRLKASTVTPKDLERWVVRLFNPDRHTEFPDLATAFASVTRADLAEFSSQLFVAERQVFEVTHPLSPYLLVLFLAVGVLVPIPIMKRLLVRRVDMTGISYVARLKLPKFLSVVAGATYGVAIAILLRGLVYGYQIIVDGMLLGINSMILQWIAYTLMLAFAIMFLILALAAVPRKILVFEDRVLLKFLTYRSVEWRAEEIGEVSLVSFSEVWLSSRIRKCFPLAFGLSSRSVFLQFKSGHSILCNVRDNEELVGVLSGLAGSSATVRSSDSVSTSSQSVPGA